MLGDLHPGVLIALRRLGADELGVAKMMAAGELSSPQPYENMHLFAMRITGTGVSYRRKHNEYVFRRPENYLTQEFVERCAGLPVIMMHPDGQMLNSKEYTDRIVGALMRAYIRGDEVWGIARIYDDSAIEAMKTIQLSTSPSVVFRPSMATDDPVNTKMRLEGGDVLLIEGKPSLLDHLAICEQGVWDKGEEPAGVASAIELVDAVRGDSQMTEGEMKAKKDADEKEEKDKKEKEENERADKARKDANEGVQPDKVQAYLDAAISKMCDTMASRMDAIADSFMKRRGDSDDKRDDKRGDEEKDKKKSDKDPDEAERVAADKGKKRGDEDKEDKRDDAHMRGKSRRHDEDEERDDRARKDAEIGEIKKMISDMSAKIPRQLSDADFADMADAQARADDVFHAFGSRAPRPLDGETRKAYRIRVAGMLKQHSAQWKDVNIPIIAADDQAFTLIEKQIYADAGEAARNPVDIPHGELREVVIRDPVTGVARTEFRGKSTFIAQMNRPSRLAKFVARRATS